VLSSCMTSFLRWSIWSRVAHRIAGVVVLQQAPLTQRAALRCEVVHREYWKLFHVYMISASDRSDKERDKLEATNVPTFAEDQARLVRSESPWTVTAEIVHLLVVGLRESHAQCRRSTACASNQKDSSQSPADVVARRFHLWLTWPKPRGPELRETQCLMEEDAT